MAKYIAIALGITAIVSAGALINRQSQSPASRPHRSTGPTIIFAPGRIEGAGEEIQLRPQLAGRIVRLAVTEGQLVQDGELLLQVDDEQYRHEVALAHAEVRQNQAALSQLISGASKEERMEAAALFQAKCAELERAEISWNRTRELRHEGVISQQEADNQRTSVSSIKAQTDAAKAHLDSIQAPARIDEMEMAKARIAAAVAKLDLANVRLKRTRLVAPADGKILQLNVRHSELTGPDSAVPAILFADTSHFRVRAHVEELDAPRVQKGMAAIVTADGMPKQELTGRVTHLSPRMGRKQLFTDDPAEHFDVRTREVWIDLQTTDNLLVGLRVDVTIDPTRTTE